MRGFEIAVAALALRASPARPPAGARRIVPAVDDADAALLDRAFLPHQRAALVASLWPPPARQCMAPPLYAALPAPAIFGVVLRVSWPGPPAAEARSGRARPDEAIPPRQRHPTEKTALAA